ncbi:MAG: ribosome biogenesis GTPase Der [Endomicrobiia bacterium]|nr:ribosome biogenesis GTPase Der [Endomicrobiaceae bacterium]MDD3052831.1 ribosome biogenesis GTPase Der [Endomicrobiaceae bacterium]
MYKKIAIVGRPNVGKSTLFNRFIGRKKAIIHDTPGTTRDRNDFAIKWKDKHFIVTDTAGWSSNVSEFSKAMSQQLDMAIQSSDIILFIVDGKEGIHPFDPIIAKSVRASKKPVILVINKIDTFAEEVKVYEFYKLGFDLIIPVSSIHGRNMVELLESICGLIGDDDTKESEEEVLKIIFVGKPNVGKSSIVNSIVQEERCIVHNTPGTTRDSLSVHATHNDIDYLLIDTAGLHRGNKTKDDMEYLSTLSTNYALDEADIAVLVADASQGIGETEAKIAGMIIEKKKPCIIAVNKWDLIEDKEEKIKLFQSQLEETLKFLDWADIIFISAKTKQRIDRIFRVAPLIYQEYSKLVTQEELNDVIRSAVGRTPYSRKGKKLKIKEAEQLISKPPTFRFSVNDLELLHFSYRRYLENCLRERFSFQGTPIILKFRQITRSKSKDIGI